MTFSISVRLSALPEEHDFGVPLSIVEPFWAAALRACNAALRNLASLRQPPQPCTPTAACYAHLAGTIDPEDMLSCLVDAMYDSSVLLVDDPQVCVRIGGIVYISRL